MGPNTKAVADSELPIEYRSNSTNIAHGSSSFSFLWGDKPRYGSAKVVAETLKSTNWDALLEAAKKASGDSECYYDGTPSNGAQNLVRRIKIPSRDEKWIARVPMDQFKDYYTPSVFLEMWNNSGRVLMEQEIATLKFFAQTNVPVPKVFGWHTSRGDDNPVGHPYMLMECIEGNTLHDIRDLSNPPRVLTEEEQTKVDKEIAMLHVKIVNATVDKFGPFRLKDNGDIEIDAIGDTVADYFKWRAQPGPPNPLNPNEPFNHYLGAEIGALLPDDYPNDFAVAHAEFSEHNMLFNDDLDLVAIIDWRDPCLAPVDVVAVTTYRDHPYHFENGVTFAPLAETVKYHEYVAEAEKQLNVRPRVAKAIENIVGQIGGYAILNKDSVWPHAGHAKKVLDHAKRGGSFKP